MSAPPTAHGNTPRAPDASALLFNAFAVDPLERAERNGALVAPPPPADASGAHAGAPTSPRTLVPRRITHAEIDALTQDIIGSYTEDQVAKLHLLQQRLDEFHYEPQCSDVGGGLDDSALWKDDHSTGGGPTPAGRAPVTDPLFHFQSNLPLIMRILGVSFGRRSSGDSERASDESGLGDGADDDDDAALERRKREQLEAFKVDMVNNSAIAEERARAHRLANFAEVVHDCSEQQQKAVLLDALQHHAPLLEEELDDPPEPIGPSERQVQMLQAVLRLRRDQGNALRRVCASLIRELETAFEKMSTMAPAQQLQEALESSEELRTARRENEALKREQIYLYYRLYGPQHKYDLKADKQKKYRREVDDAYKQMVDAEVAKKVVKAVKNSEAWTRKAQLEVEAYRQMMQKAHLKLMGIHGCGKMALHACRTLERDALRQHDGYECAMLIQEALGDAGSWAADVGAPGASAKQRQSVSGAATPPPNTGGASLAHGSSISSRTRAQDAARGAFDAICRELRAAVREQLPAVAAQLVDSTQQLPPTSEVLRGRASALSGAVDVVLGAATHTAATVLAACTAALPASLAASATRTIQAQLATQLAAAAAAALSNFAHAVAARDDRHGVWEDLSKQHRATNPLLPPPLPSVATQTECVDDSVSDSLSVMSGAASSAHRLRGGEGSVPAMAARRRERRTATTPRRSSESGGGGGSEGTGSTSHRSSVVAHDWTDDAAGGDSEPRGEASGRGGRQMRRARSSTLSLRRGEGAGRGPNSSGTGGGGGSRRHSSVAGGSSAASATAATTAARHPHFGADHQQASSADTSQAGHQSLSSSVTEPQSQNATLRSALRRQTSSGGVRGEDRDQSGENHGTAATHESPAHTSPRASRGDVKGGSGGGVPTVERRSVAVGTLPRHTRNAFCQVAILDPVKHAGGEKSGARLPPAASTEIAAPAAARRRLRRNSSGPGVGSVTDAAAPSAAAAAAAAATTSAVAGGEVSKAALSPEDDPAAAVELPREGNIVFVFAGIDDAHVFWQRCAAQMPKLMEVYLHALRDALHDHNGTEARCEADAFLAVFARPVDALSWALSVQQHLMELPYPRQILAQESGVKITGPDGKNLWRGFRVRMGIHMGSPNVRLQPLAGATHGRECPTSRAPQRVVYDGTCVTLAARLAMLAHGGQVLISGAVADALKEHLPSLVSVGLRPQGECPLEAGTECVFDAVDAVTAGRHFSAITAVDAPLSGGRLYQWLCTYAAAHDLAVFDRIAFCCAEVQGPADFPDHSARAVSTAASAVMEEARRLVEKNRGSIAKVVGNSVMAAFADVADAARFALSLQVRALQLPYSADVLAVPQCREQYAGNFMCWRGLRVRAGLHFGRPDHSIVNRATRAVEYFGSEVARAVAVATAAQFGETVLSEPMTAEVTVLLEKLDGARIAAVGQRRAGGERLELHALHPAALFARHAQLSAVGGSELPIRDMFTPSTASARPSSDDVALEEYELGDTTCVLCCCIDRADELLATNPQECTRAMNLFLAVLRDVLQQADGFEAHQDAVSCYAFFDIPEAAVAAAVNVQDKLMHVPFNSDIERVFPEVIGDTSQDVIFRGLRVSMGLQRGRVHEFVAGAGIPKSFWGSAITQGCFLANAYACGGELLLTEAVMSDLQQAEAGPRGAGGGLLSQLHTYRIENILLPGDHRRTGVFGALPHHLAARRRYFFRGKKAGVHANAAASAPSPASASSMSPPGGAFATSPNMDRRRQHKFTLDPLASPAGGLIGVNSSSFSATTAGPTSPHLGSGGGSGGSGGRGLGSPQLASASSADIAANSFTAADAAPHGAGRGGVSFDAHPHRCNAQLVQSVYRTAWRIAGKVGRVMGYPVSVDPDPVMFDAALREAAVSNYEGEELDSVLFEAEHEVLARVQEMLGDAGLALGCTLERGTYFHRAMQSAIIIPPDDRAAEVLYHPVDVGPGKRVTLDRGGGKQEVSGAALVDAVWAQVDAAAATVAAAGGSGDSGGGGLPVLGGECGFRPGVSSDFAVARMRERRMMELEEAAAAAAAATRGGRGCGGALVLAGKLGAAAADVGTQVGAPDAGALGRLCSRSSTPGAQRGSSNAKLTLPPPLRSAMERIGTPGPGDGGSGRCPPRQRKLQRAQAPLAALQTGYLPDFDAASSLQLHGEPSSEATLLAPFSHKTVPRPLLALDTISGGMVETATSIMRAGTPTGDHHHLQQHGLHYHERHVARQPMERVRLIRARPSTLDGPARPGTLPFYAQRAAAQHRLESHASVVGGRSAAGGVARSGRNTAPLLRLGSRTHGTADEDGLDPFPPPPPGAPSVDFVD